MTADQEPRRDWICMSLLVGALAGIAFGCVRIIALVGAKDCREHLALITVNSNLTVPERFWQIF